MILKEETVKHPLAQMENIAQRSQSRQQFLNTLITTGAGILLSCSRREHLATNAEVLEICRESLPRLWSLYFEGDLVTVEHALPIYMLQLTLLAKTSFSGQREAQQLVADAHMLASLLATQSAHFGQAQTEARCALVFARAANDENRIIVAYIRMAQALKYRGLLTARLGVYEDAVALISGQTSPLVTGRVYLGYAETLATAGSEAEAQRYYELAVQTFPPFPQDDPAFAYTHFRGCAANIIECQLWMHTGKVKQARDHLEQRDPFVAKRTPDWLELRITQAEAAYKDQDMQATTFYLEDVLPAASELNNKLRYETAKSLYQQANLLWSREQKVEHLAQLISHYDQVTQRNPLGNDGEDNQWANL
jgi:tetratricopeptide (TPR) repeat protein